MEIWKAIPGFEGGYEVSNLGRVRSLDRSVECQGPVKGRYRSIKKGRLLKPAPASHYYPTVVLGRAGGTRTVHSLVAAAFIGPCPPGKEVMHADGSRDNCAADNLFYGTRSDNNRQIILDGRRKITVAQLKWARKTLAVGQRGVGVRVARALSLSPSQVSNIKHGRHYAHVG